MQLFATLKWRRQTTTEDGFRVYRDTKPIDLNNLPEPIAILPPGSTSFRDEGLVNQVQHHYVVSVFKGNLEKFGQEQTFTPSILDFGPGPQTLVGNNDTAGFFGEVPVTELINGPDLASLLSLTAGTAQNPSAPWLKFFIDDKIVYIPKMTYRHTISWDHLNAVNTVYGDRIIEIGGYQYRIGLLKGLNPDPDPDVSFGAGYDTEWAWGSEWNRLLYNISAEHTNPDYHKTSQVGENWANYTQAELNITSGNGRYNWCQETAPNNANNRVLRGSLAVSYLSSFTSSSASSLYGWRPRLELITT